MIDKVDEYIKAYTNKCSNEIAGFPNQYQPWLAPYHGFAIADIARKEVYEDFQSLLNGEAPMIHKHGCVKEIYTTECKHCGCQFSIHKKQTSTVAPLLSWSTNSNEEFSRFRVCDCPECNQMVVIGLDKKED